MGMRFVWCEVVGCDADNDAINVGVLKWPEEPRAWGLEPGARLTSFTLIYHPLLNPQTILASRYHGTE